LVGRVDLLLAVGIRLIGRDLDAVLGGKGVDDSAIVRPIRGQGDDVELAFGFRRGDQGVHAAHVGCRCRGLGRG
jgi:hypothetical protein